MENNIYFRRESLFYNVDIKQIVIVILITTSLLWEIDHPTVHWLIEKHTHNRCIVYVFVFLTRHIFAKCLIILCIDLSNKIVWKYYIA
jgi:hypothetical protein